MNKQGEASTSCPIVELRRYSLHPGKREALIALFDRELVETQEECNMAVMAQFRDIDDPDVFTWLRGFADMDSRKAALTAFYDGPAWITHRDAANATMIDSDNVRLLRPVNITSGFEPRGANRPNVDATSTPPGLTVITIYTIVPQARAGFADFFDRMIAPEMSASGAPPRATLETAPYDNTFPRLPVREHEHAFVWFAQFDDVRAYEGHLAMLRGSREWSGWKHALLREHLCAPVERWRLTRTARSLPLVSSVRRDSSDQTSRGQADP